MSIEFESPATRVIEQFSGKDEEQFRIPTDLPDLTFLRALSVQGRLVFLQGELTGTAQADITPPTGQTFFFFKGYFLNRSTANQSDLEIQNDGNVRWAARLLAGNNNIEEISFMDSLVGNGTKTFTISHINTGIMQFSIYGWNENTSRIRDVTI